MPAKEIKELRQSGRLEEALAMAQNELNNDPDNIWGKRNISWVYYEYLKKYADESRFDDFVNWLTKLKSLELPESEVMIFDTSSWQIAKVVFSIQKSEPLDYSRINQLFDLIKNFHFTKSSESYTLLYKAFHKGYKNWSRYIEFADWWNFENFRPEDYQKEEYKGRSIMSIVEQAYIAYSKKLLEGIPVGEFGAQRIIDGAKIHSFIPKLDAVIDQHPEYQYPPYFKVKLLISVDEGEGVFKTFLPFAKQKRNDYWVWELMAEIFQDDKEMQLACYCKALSLKTREDFLVKIREQFAELLIDMEFYAQAKTEIEKIVLVRREHNWRITSKVSGWLESDWFDNSDSYTDNKQFYIKYARNAKALLYRDIPEQLIAVEFVNKDKKILNFVKNKDYHGFFNYQGFNIKPKIGDVIKARLVPKGDKGFYNLLTLNTDNELEQEKCEAIKKVSGFVNIREGQNFAFLDDIFISPDIVSKHNLNDGDELTCNAIMSYNKKKSEWGWKGLEVLQ